jgi:hypothetical protein
MHKVLSYATDVEEWLEVLAAEVGILDRPEQITVGEIYTLLSHRDELQSALEDSEILETVWQRVEEVDWRLLEKAEVIINAENLARRREQHSREEGLPVSAWWWHLDEILAGLRYLGQVPEQPRKRALAAMFPKYMRAIETTLPSVREGQETYGKDWLINFLIPDWNYVSIAEFVSFWESLYPASFPSEEKYRSAEECYSKNVRDVEVITEENLRALFRWKHGQTWEKASGKKKAAFEKAMENIERLNEFKHYQHVTDKQVEDFLRFLSRITRRPIYKAFFFHICRPFEFALYDQHVYCSWQFLVYLEIKERPDDFEVYKQYNKFFSEWAQKLDTTDLWEARRRLDKALMAFGQFIKRNAVTFQSKEITP